MTVGGDVIGIGPMSTLDTEQFDAYGLQLYEPDSGSMKMMRSWPWDGRWFAEDMFTIGESLVVVSLSDRDGSPLPALLFDAVRGESWTEPSAGFVRPFLGQGNDV